jgi:wyosine [tRNA(Phe)-imidazoG37] synthetase (radical SAM superfamily)
MPSNQNDQSPAQIARQKNGADSPQLAEAPATAFGYPKDFLANRFVYIVVSPRAGGLSIGVNMNPDKECNFDCLYCEVDRQTPGTEARLDVKVMADELKATLRTVRSGDLQTLPRYRRLPGDLLRLQHVALSGDGEPTLAEAFAEAVEAVVHVRAVSGLPFVKIILISNATGLDRPQVQNGIKLLTRADEIWVKLDGGTQAYVEKIDRPKVPLSKVLENILTVGRQRPVVVQSLFPALNGVEPPEEEIAQYALRLKELKAGGAQISLVQIYSATRPMPRLSCGHLPLKTLSRIAQTVRDVAGLRAEVF